MWTSSLSPNKKMPSIVERLKLRNPNEGKENLSVLMMCQFTMSK